MLAPTSPSAPTHDCMNDIKAKGITIVGSEQSFRVAREAWLVRSASRSSNYSLGFPTSGFCFGMEPAAKKLGSRKTKAVVVEDRQLVRDRTDAWPVSSTS